MLDNRIFRLPGPLPGGSWLIGPWDEQCDNDCVLVTVHPTGWVFLIEIPEPGKDFVRT